MCFVSRELRALFFFVLCSKGRVTGIEAGGVSCEVFFIFMCVCAFVFLFRFGVIFVFCFFFGIVGCDGGWRMIMSRYERMVRRFFSL